MMSISGKTAGELERRLGHFSEIYCSGLFLSARWFVLSLVITLGAAAVYLLRTPSVYTRSASILIKEDSKGQSVSSEMDFANLGLFQSNTNVNNEMLTLRSPAIMYEVARRLSLHKTYMMDGRFHKVVAYGTSLPLTVDIAGFPESEGAGMTVAVAEDGAVTLSEFSRSGVEIDSGPVQAVLGKPVSTPIGEVTVSPTPFFMKGNGCTIYFTQTSIQAAASGCSLKEGEETGACTTRMKKPAPP